MAYHKVIDSKKELNSILFLTNGNEPGTYSKDECFQSILLFKEITKKYPNLIIKMVSSVGCFFFEWNYRLNFPNCLILLERSTNLRDQINNWLVISRNTSTALEAMVLNKPVVSINR